MIPNVVIVDPILGVRKAAIGIRDGRIAAIGRAGNPDTMDGPSTSWSAPAPRSTPARA